MFKRFQRGALYGATLTVLMVTLVAAGCGSSEDVVFTGQGSPARPDSPLTVAIVNPGDGAVNVALNAAVFATFNQVVDRTSVSSTTFLVTGPNASPVAGSVTTTGGSAVFTPSQPFAANTNYTATLTTGLRGENGLALAAPFSWSFTTGATSDTTAPTVTFTDPANGESGVATNQGIAVTFSEALNPTTLNSQTFGLRGPGQAVVGGTVSNLGLTATFTPNGALTANTTYTATISPGPTDLAGNPLAAPYVWTFTTAAAPDTTAPTVTFVDPTNGETDVAVNQNILANFSETMEPTSLASRFTVSGPGNAAVPGTVTYMGLTATFNPASDLESSKLYTATVAAGATDLAGNPLAQNFSWTFTTSAAPDTTAPTVVSTDPTDNEQEVAVNRSVVAGFSETMQPLTNTVFTLSGPGGNVDGTVNNADRTATFSPLNDLLPRTTYTATISTEARDSAGNPLATPEIWTFTTSAAVDSTAPTVVSTSPDDNATNVNVSSDVSATFSENMLPSTLNTASFRVAGVAGTVTYDLASKTATFHPTDNLDVNTVYNVTITTEATDLAGNPLAAEVIWSFRTSVIDLGAASPYGTFGGNAGITNQGLLTRINNGAIGTTGAATLITGFIDGTNGDTYTVTPSNAGIVELGIFTAGDPEAAAGANDAQTAFDTLRDLTGGITLATTQLGGRTLAPGIYKSATTYEITGNSSLFDLTLDGQGDPNALWVFQVGSSLTVGGPALPRSVNLIGGAQAKNVYWQVGSAATINGAGGGRMVGTIISSAGATFSTAGNVEIVTLDGRAISLNASVTLVNTVINVPSL